MKDRRLRRRQRRDGSSAEPGRDFAAFIDRHPQFLRGDLLDDDRSRLRPLP